VDAEEERPEDQDEVGNARHHLPGQERQRLARKAIKVNAKYEVAWNNKGNALSRLGKNDWALQCYEQALALDPSYRTAWVNKGYVLAKLGRFDEAAGCADRALQLTAGASA